MKRTTFIAVAILGAVALNAFGQVALPGNSGANPADSGPLSQPANPAPTLAHVPEPSTIFAGASLCLPLGACFFRILRRQEKP